MPNVLTLPQNTKGRDFVVGDIHGAYPLLEKALKQARFDPEKDRLISVGDLVDRGPQSPLCLAFLKQSWFFAVRGNHEDLFLDICRADGSFDAEKAENNRRNGMDWIFGETAGTLAAIHAAFSALPLAIEIPTDRGTVGFIHAEVPQGQDWSTFKDNIENNDRKTVQSALWSRKRIEHDDRSGVEGIDRLFSGHTPQERGPRRLGNCYYIDTGAVFRMLFGDVTAEDFHLTMSDICAETASLDQPPKNRDDKQVILDVPENPKPFSRKKGGPRP